ncbi:hypothetical protein GCM10011490_17990 [Pseudoclavibacter endophyticus]|uniref:SAF domain-containing protein n=1 Tax=Pseudoclavibacter endophyticus TaxID=1778590 RepID=A0A6H9WHT1_9MICO|nr:SAF domain-containing protein [Pseudoclavibacter endophyticus]KAB1648853.1 hypothetical protein F8O04_00670 [Pseudoclavibacter endophyticus]GGA67819.1 hypothetical protein GCM10011490_17990 [Pseudoclavibacter endophyticus]
MMDALSTSRGTTRTAATTTAATSAPRAAPTNASAPPRGAPPRRVGGAADPDPVNRRDREASPTRQRRRPLLIAVGVVLVLVAALTSYVTFSNLSTSVTVVVAAADLAKGDVIEATDLGSIEIVGGQHTNAIPAADAATLIGQHAAVDLPAGSLLTTGTVQGSLPVEPGTSIVGVAVAVGQVPSSGVRAGDRIRLVSTPVAQGEPPVEAPLTIDAVVFATRTDDRTGALVVDVVVPTGVAADVAARAATGRISIVLDGSGEE